MSKLAIVIPVFNEFHFTKPCLNDLLKLDPKEHLIVVVDNGSTDATKDLKDKDNFLVYRFEENQGFGKSCSYGYQQIKKYVDNVMFLNNDIRVISDYQNWTDRVIEKCHLGLVGPTIGVLDNEFNFVGEYEKIPTTRKNYYLSGWNISSSVKNWEKLCVENEMFSAKPFNSLFFAYFEDSDLSFRAREMGIDLILQDVPVRHLKNGTSRKMNLPKMYHDSKKIFTELWCDKCKT